MNNRCIACWAEFLKKLFDNWGTQQTLDIPTVDELYGAVSMLSNIMLMHSELLWHILLWSDIVRCVFVQFMSDKIGTVCFHLSVLEW